MDIWREMENDRRKEKWDDGMIKDSEMEKGERWRDIEGG